MFVSQRRNSVPSTVIKSEDAQPARFEKKKNKAMLPEAAPTTRLAGE